MPEDLRQLGTPVAIDGDKQPPENHGNDAHTETFAVDGDEQPPQEHGNEAHDPDFAQQSDFDDHNTRHQDGGADEINVAGLSGDLADPQDPKDHGNDAHSPNFSEEGHDHTDVGESIVPVAGIDLPSVVVENPDRLPIAELDDDESIEIAITVPDGDTLEVYRWGVFDVSDGTAPTGLDAELLDGGDTVQASENTVDSSDEENPIASHENTSGSMSIFKLRAKNDTGSAIDEPGVGSHFGYVVV